MLRRLLIASLFAGLGFGVLAALPTNAAEPPDAAKIKQLIEQLGSGKFDEREQATKDLDAIGAPALEGLKKAMKSDDAEVSRRATDLAKTIEKRAESETVLKATKIHLVFKDTPVTEAVAELKKKSGYNIVLHDPQHNLKDKTVTLDTGETTFWQALDQLCEKAGLHEGAQHELIGQPFGQPQLLPLDGPRATIAPALPPPPAKAVPPEKPPEPAPAAKPDKPGNALAAADEPPPPPAARPIAPPAGGGAAAGGARALPRPALQQPSQITLLEGKPEVQPTDYRGVVRIRAVTNVAAILGNAEEGTILLGLQVSTEPKITWQGLVGLKIDKAIDDNDQKLAEAMAPNGPGGVRGVGLVGPVAAGGPFPFVPVGRMGNGGSSQFVPVRLKKGEKASKALKELSGTVSAEVLAEPKTLITTDEVLNSAGKTFKGDEGGSIKIVSVDKNTDDGEGVKATVVFELERPAGFVVPPINKEVGGLRGAVPGVAPALPLPPRGAAGQPPPGAGFQVQAVQGQAAPAQVIQIQVQVGGAVQVNNGGPAAATFAPFNGGTAGLKLVDDKGNTVTGASIGMRYKAQPGGGRAVPEYLLTIPLKKDQTEAGKLIFAASKSVTVDIPFTLKDIVLP